MYLFIQLFRLPFQNSYYNYQNDPDKISIVIDFTDGKSYDVTVLKSDFITLEQWREQQLNQILEQ